MKKLSLSASVVTRAVVLLGLVAIIFPLVWIFSLSLKLPNEVFQANLILIPKHVALDNYMEAFNYARMYFKIGFARMYLNSFILSAATIILTLLIALLAGFALASFRFHGQALVMTLVLASFMIPTQILLIPLFVLFKRAHLLNTYLAPVLAYTLFTVPIAVLIFRSFFAGIPRELREAAVIDGANDVSYFQRIAVPIAKPAVATCIIYSFTLTWNEFLLALVFLGKDTLKPLPVAIANMAGGQYIVPYNIFTASMMICILPVLVIFLLLQKWFLRSVTAGALKG
jgi:ABC-type glycerol-3-phosphate transport system permease component